MRNEDWKRAEDAYKRILAMQPASAAALAGERRSGRMLRLHQQIDVYLNDPDRLSSDEPLEHARRLLDTARAGAGPGPRLSAAITRLDKLIETASRPRPVVLKSDGETAVTIYRVARFGTLTLKRIELRPGKYTAVGSRPGFRDVRVEFRIPDSGDPTTVVVQCVERI